MGSMKRKAIGSPSPSTSPIKLKNKKVANNAQHFDDDTISKVSKKSNNDQAVNISNYTHYTHDQKNTSSSDFLLEKGKFNYTFPDKLHSEDYCEISPTLIRPFDGKHKYTREDYVREPIDIFHSSRNCDRHIFDIEQNSSSSHDSHYAEDYYSEPHSRYINSRKSSYGTLRRIDSPRRGCGGSYVDHNTSHPNHIYNDYSPSNSSSQSTHYTQPLSHKREYHSRPNSSYGYSSENGNKIRRSMYYDTMSINNAHYGHRESRERIRYDNYQNYDNDSYSERHYSADYPGRVSRNSFNEHDPGILGYYGHFNDYSPPIKRLRDSESTYYSFRNSRTPPPRSYSFNREWSREYWKEIPTGSTSYQERSEPYAYSDHSFRKPLSPYQDGSSSFNYSSLKDCTDEDGHYIVREGDYLNGRFVIVKLLGQGTFGKVVEVVDEAYNTHVAVKIIRALPKYSDAGMEEIRILEAISKHDMHKNNGCVELIDWFVYRKHICLVFDLYTQSLFDFLKSNSFSPYPKSHIIEFTYQILKALKFLHSIRLVHTDLKPENLMLVDDNYKILANNIKVLNNTELVLIDFGSAVFYRGTKRTSTVSTRHYRAPEIILEAGWSFPCDIWSVGCILVELFTGEVLFQTHDNAQHLALMERIIGKFDRKFTKDLPTKSASLFKRNGEVDYPLPDTSARDLKFVNKAKSLHNLIQPESKVDFQILDLLQQMLEFNPDKRITSEEALLHPLFKDISKFKY